MINKTFVYLYANTFQISSCVIDDDFTMLIYPMFSLLQLLLNLVEGIRKSDEQGTVSRY